ncbi:hypothetical protein TNCV_5064091 [Trichonephila clavipes]|nr:hypothetical protein TNCV_5064091 [Trichonephila clavipes]
MLSCWKFLQDSIWKQESVFQLRRQTPYKGVTDLQLCSDSLQLPQSLQPELRVPESLSHENVLQLIKLLPPVCVHGESNCLTVEDGTP